MKPIYKLIFLALPLLFASCIKDGFDKENCPGDFIIVPVVPDESGDVDFKESYGKVIDANGNEIDIETGSDKTVDLEDGTYTVVVVNGAKEDQVTIKGTTVTVVTNPDGTAGEPGKLIGGHTNITVGGNNGGGQETPKIEVPVEHQTRPLILKINFEGENLALLQSLKGIVDGIALSRDLNHGFKPLDGQDRHPASASGSISYAFSPNEEAENSYQSMRTLLGIDGSGQQTLTLTVGYKGDIQQTYTFDITRQLDGFHTEDVTNPWVIEIMLRLGTDFQATIEDWKAGPESWMDAH